ncbi:SH3 domain-containing protein [Pseudalkalibacillus sp. A8]|uniref:SH3 domain-containing protein n=1 Tax=Pseudalkalibacillus sp. A8 TaxID=3382641 RepID=UPI0038B6A950
MAAKKGWIAGWFAIKISKSSNGSTGSSSSPTGQWVSSKVDGLNVRSGPDTSFSILGQIYPHEKFQTIEAKESWIKINYKNSTGWLDSWLIESTSKPSSSQNPTSTERSVVNATSLNVRSGPGTNYNVIGSVSKGDVVEIMNIQNSWYEINLKQGKGWVAGKYVTKGQNSDSSSGIPSALSPTVKAKVTASILTVRDKGSLNGKVIGQLTKNSQVNIVKKENDWAYIENGKTKG